MILEVRKILQSEILVLNSNKIPLKPNKKYKVNTQIICKKDELYSSYFLVEVKNDSDKEIVRYFCWINDSSGKPKDHTIIFTTPSNVKYAILGYRVNSETSERSYHEIGVTDLNSLRLEEVDSSLKDSYDKFEKPMDSYLEPLSADQENILESKIVWIFCTPRSGSSWLAKNLLIHNDNTIWDEPLVGAHFNLWADQLTRPEYFFF